MEHLTIILLVSAICTALIGWFLQKYKKLWSRIIAIFFWLCATLLVSGGGYSYWYYHRPIPKPVEKQLFEGISYIREIYDTPRPMVVHIVKILLDTPGIELLVTPETPLDGYQLAARTTSQFVQEFDVQLAINASFFEPFWVNWPRYYPHVGDPASVFGLAISQGQSYSSLKPGYNTIYFSQDNQVSIGKPLENPYNAFSGHSMFVREGKFHESFLQGSQYYVFGPSPRTTIAIDKSGRELMIFVVDGRQPNYSDGIPLPELAEIAISQGAYTALNLDGGGSSTLVMEGADGKPVVLNSPIHRRVPPGQERPVANHLGIFAKRLPQS